jgi:hypothetical protein
LLPKNSKKTRGYSKKNRSEGVRELALLSHLNISLLVSALL